MNGGFLAGFRRTFVSSIIIALLISGAVGAISLYVLFFNTELSPSILFLALTAVILFISSIIGLFISSFLFKPLQYLTQAIFHVSPNQHHIAAPNLNNLAFGRQLVTTLTRQIYDNIATTNVSNSTPAKPDDTSLIDTLPTPIIGLDSAGLIVIYNAAAATMCGESHLHGKRLNQIVSMKFPSQSIDEWLVDTKDAGINNYRSWNKIDVTALIGDHRSQYDITAASRQANQSGIETIMVFFEHADVFASEQEAVNLLALSVHEIRTPLTIMRGYIEALKNELTPSADERTRQYIDRLSASSDNLMSYMANIVSVAKSDQSQLHLQLQEADWATELSRIVGAMKTRLSVRGKHINLDVAANLPTVGIDSIGIGEVMTNLIDNAVKYSSSGDPEIKVSVTKDKDGLVVTSVHDKGVGIPESVVPHLFTRFYRNHRNRDVVAGTGLGLFISKEIISAHHGNIWIQSTEGEGTTVSFTLMPYDKLAQLPQSSDNNFVKVQHGWIKNHNMQRR